MRIYELGLAEQTHTLPFASVSSLGHRESVRKVYTVATTRTTLLCRNIEGRSWRRVWVDRYLLKGNKVDDLLEVRVYLVPGSLITIKRKMWQMWRNVFAVFVEARSSERSCQVWINLTEGQMDCSYRAQFSYLGSKRSRIFVAMENMENCGYGDV